MKTIVKLVCVLCLIWSCGCTPTKKPTSRPADQIGCTDNKCQRRIEMKPIPDKKFY